VHHKIQLFQTIKGIIHYRIYHKFITYFSSQIVPPVGITAFTMTTNHTYERRKQLFPDKHGVSTIPARRLLSRMVGVPDTRSEFCRRFWHVFRMLLRSRIRAVEAQKFLIVRCSKVLYSWSVRSVLEI